MPKRTKQGKGLLSEKTLLVIAAGIGAVWLYRKAASCQVSIPGFEVLIPGDNRELFPLAKNTVPENRQQYHKVMIPATREEVVDEIFHGYYGISV